MVYLDYSATTPVLPEVLDSYNKVTEEDKGYLKLVLNVNDKEITFLKLPKRITIEDKNILFDNNLFKLYLKKEKKYKIEKSKYTEYELQKILEKTAENEILKGLEKDEYKLLQKTLKKYNNNGKMYIEVFFKTYEDISLEKNIQKVETEKEEE